MRPWLPRIHQPYLISLTNYELIEEVSGKGPLEILLTTSHKQIKN